MRPFFALSAIAALALPMTAASAQEAAEAVRFIACPVYRDTDAGRKSGCWLVTDPATGRQWDVTQSPYKPDWNFAVLVEGTVAATSDQPCGAPVLDPVRSSRLMDQPCVRHMLPAEGYPGRRFVLPPRNLSPLSTERPPAPGPYAERTFTLFFEFDRSMMVYQYGDYLLDEAAHWIRSAQPRRLVITGFAATGPEEVSGQTIAERPEVARERAESVAMSFERLFPGLEIEVRTQLDAEVNNHPDADGIAGQSQRRVEVTALF